jgi:phosphoribosylformylglycinamidine synthase
VNEDGRTASEYPMNPSGSEDGVAGVCSRNGRHLAIMPHPERYVLKTKI